ncbi:MAG: GNAT family N-acetyltransferase [Acidobacteria bacterium]|nr:GNAT family N-acetyltransferase [Acidobacteriota bacterium]
MSTETEQEAHSERAEIKVRQCVTIDEFEACVRLQREVFKEPDIEISPRRHLIASRRAGGWTLGAFAGSELVGFVHLMVGARDDHEVIGYSHMMAVALAYQNQGLGARLKWAQRERCLREGKRYITWTWHPMQARNAYFNLNRLSVTVRSYAVNFYGTDTDYAAAIEGEAPSAGIDSDRLFADWDLDSARVVERAKGLALDQTTAPVKTIEIPPDWLALLKSDAAAARREQLRAREEFMSAFASGLVCGGFERDREHPRYLLYESVAGDR